MNLGLIKGRHNIPQVDQYVFNANLNPTDVNGTENLAYNFLSKLKVNHINLYVTGLTMALVAVLNSCKDLDIKVTLFHFDKETGSYFPQVVA
jgi:hypothetical protein